MYRRGGRYPCFRALHFRPSQSEGGDSRITDNVMVVKITLYVIGLILLAIAGVHFVFPDMLLGVYANSEGLLRNFERLFFAFLFSVIGLLCIVLAAVQRARVFPSSGSQPEAFWYHSISPLFLAIAGAAASLMVYYDIGFDYYGAKTILYIGSGLLFMVGFAGLVARLFKR